MKTKRIENKEIELAMKVPQIHGKYSNDRQLDIQNKTIDTNSLLQKIPIQS